MRLKVGQHAPRWGGTDIYGRPISLADYQGSYLLLSFYRSAVCPLCNVRLANQADQAWVFDQQSLKLVAFVESFPELARHYLDRLHPPFPILADRSLIVYTLYGLETSWLGTALGTLRRSTYREARQKRLGVWQLLRGFLAMDGRKFRMPADFLIGPDLRILRAHYAHDAGDFLSLAQIIEDLQVDRRL